MSELRPVSCGVGDLQEGMTNVGDSRRTSPSRPTYTTTAERVSPSSPFILLVEGANGEVWRCTEANVPAVACLGAELTNSQAEKVAALNKKIYIAFDNDEAGNEAAGGP